MGCVGDWAPNVVPAKLVSGERRLGSIVVDDEKLVQDVVDASSLLSENTFAD